MEGKVIDANTVEPLMNSYLRNLSEVVVREGWLLWRGLHRVNSFSWYMLFSLVILLIECILVPRCTKACIIYRTVCTLVQMGKLCILSPLFMKTAVVHVFW